MTRIARRRRVPVTTAVCAAAALLIAACGGGSSNSNSTTTDSSTAVRSTNSQTSSTSVASQSSAAYGKYVGNAGTSLTISFTASLSGIGGLTGEALLVCTQTTGNSVQYGVNSIIPLNRDGSFTSDTTTNLPSGGTAELKVSGALDGSGHATGTLSDNLANACDTGSAPEHWIASIGGSTTPTTAPSSSGCTPQPCDTSGGLTLSVTGLTNVAAGTAGNPNVVEVQFTVTNNDTKVHLLSGAIDNYGVQPANEATIQDDDVDALTLADGSSCRADDADLQPGAHSPVLHTCVNLTDAQLSEPLKFIWSIDSAGGTIDLTNMTIGG
jgi:hypothetical protein